MKNTHSNELTLQQITSKNVITPEKWLWLLKNEDSTKHSVVESTVYLLWLVQLSLLRCSEQPASYLVSQLFSHTVTFSSPAQNPILSLPVISHLLSNYSVLHMFLTNTTSSRSCV